MGSLRRLVYLCADWPIGLLNCSSKGRVRIPGSWGDGMDWRVGFTIAGKRMDAMQHGNSSRRFNSA